MAAAPPGGHDELTAVFLGLCLCVIKLVADLGVGGSRKGALLWEGAGWLLVLRLLKRSLRDSLSDCSLSQSSKCELLALKDVLMRLSSEKQRHF